MIKFAEKIKRLIDQQTQKNEPLFGIATSENMNVRYWQGKVKDYLVRRALYNIAKKMWRNLPENLGSLEGVAKTSEKLHQKIWRSKFSNKMRNGTVRGTLARELEKLLMKGSSGMENEASKNLHLFLQICSKMQKKHESEGGIWETESVSRRCLM